MNNNKLHINYQYIVQDQTMSKCILCDVWNPGLVNGKIFYRIYGGCRVRL